MANPLVYGITQDGITALREKYTKPAGDWAQRYGHILLSDFVNLHPDGLTKAEIASLYGTIGLEHFEELHRRGYFRADQPAEIPFMGYSGDYDSQGNRRRNPGFTI